MSFTLNLDTINAQTPAWNVSDFSTGYVQATASPAWSTAVVEVLRSQDSISWESFSPTITLTAAGFSSPLPLSGIRYVSFKVTTVAAASAVARLSFFGDAAQRVTIDAAAVAAVGAVMESDYDANTILAATADDTPAALTVDQNTLVGRQAAGITDIAVAASRLVGRTAISNVDALTAAEAKGVLGIDASDVTYTPSTSADWPGEADPGDLDDAINSLAVTAYATRFRIPSQSYDFGLPGNTGAARSTSNTITPAANNIYLWPFFVYRKTVYDLFMVDINTGILAAKMKGGVYSSNTSVLAGNSYPNALLLATDEWVLAAGAQTLTDAIALTLSPGIYWIGVQTDTGAQTINGMTADPSVRCIPGTSATGGHYSHVYSASGGYPTFLDPFGAPGNYGGNNYRPWLAMRVA